MNCYFIRLIKITLTYSVIKSSQERYDVVWKHIKVFMINQLNNSRSTFLRLKNGKKGYYGNKSLSLAWDLDVIFLGIPNLWLDGVKKIILGFGSKGVMEKCVSCFIVYPF